MTKNIEFLIEMALAAGKIISDGYHSSSSQVFCKSDIDMVTEIDLKSEKLLIDKIRKEYPNDGILTEEDSVSFEQSERVWVMNPLDGTTNFIHRFPFIGVSIGLEIDDQMNMAVVYNPILNELFYAEINKGAYLNHKQINVSEIDSLERSLIATGFPYDRWQEGDYYIREYLAFMKKCQGVRRAGAAAVDLCYCACGRIDGFFERKLKPWDTAAGSLIVKEAGGTVTDFNKQLWNYKNKTILVSNSLIHNDMYNTLTNAHN